MKKRTYIIPLLRMPPMDTEQIIANTPMTNGLQDGNGNPDDYGLGGNDDGTGGSGDDGGLIWGDAKGDNGLWSDMW